MKTDFIKELEKGNLNFKKIEKLLFQLLIEIFRHLMVEILETIDTYLMATRDAKRYTLKERKSRTIQTLVGEVTFKRRYYWDKEEHKWVYLLDQALGLEAYDRVSSALTELAVIWAAKGPSYRDAEARLADLYGAQILSHEATRQMLLQAASFIEREEQNSIGTQDSDKRAVEAIFIEVDGFNTYMQRKKKRGRGRQETKLAVIHEGWEVRQGFGDKADYRLVNPTYVPIVDTSQEFWEHIRGILDAKYKNIDTIPVIINGDEAAWIRQGENTFRNAFYQYDRFHISRAITEAFRGDRENLRKAQKALAEEDTGRLLCVVTEAYHRTREAAAKERLKALRENLINNHEHIRDYRQRLQEAGIKVSPAWRGMGAAESNVNKFKNRVAKRGRAWSQQGLKGILTCLTKLYQGVLPEYVSRTAAEVEDRLLDKLKGGAGRIARTISSSGIGVRKGTLPAIRHGTEGYACLFRQLLKPELL